MLYYGFDEQARHEHMSDEYKDRCIIIVAIAHILGLSDQHKVTT